MEENALCCFCKHCEENGFELVCGKRKITVEIYGSCDSFEKADYIEEDPENEC